MSEISLPPCEAACTRLCLDFANGIDARDHERCANVFASDAVFDHITGRIEGRDGVMRMLQSRPADMVIRHMCTNIDITLTVQVGGRVVDEQHRTVAFEPDEMGLLVQVDVGDRAPWTAHGVIHVDVEVPGLRRVDVFPPSADVAPNC